MVAAFAYVIVLVLVALLVPLILNLSRRVDAEVKAESSAQVQLIASTAAGRLRDLDELDALVERSAGALGGRVLIVGRAGRVLADSEGTARGALYATRPEIAAALRGGTEQGTRRSETLDEEILYTTVPTVRNGVPTGAVRATQSYEAVRNEMREDALALLGLGLGALLLGLAVAWVLASGLARPLATLAATARRIASGDLEARARPTGSREHREVAEEFNEMAERLGQALAAQRDFAGNASHQLRTPLTGLKLRLEAAAYKTDDPAVRRDLDAAERETDRLERLLADLLTLARDSERGHDGDEVELGAVVRAAGERWAERARAEGRRIEVTPGEEVWVSASASDLAAILDNLIENAITYSKADARVELSRGRAGESAYLTVDDEGPGVPSEEIERVFERFYRGHDARAKPGTGLGLAIVETLARRWGGEAELSSTRTGTHARVTFPAALAAEARPGSRR